MGYLLKCHKKDIHKNPPHPDKDKQIKLIQATIKDNKIKNIPTISIDTKKKELVGQFKRSGKSYMKKGEFQHVNEYDYSNWGLGKAVPYGIYDIFTNKGYVNVGQSANTADLAIESIKQWWYKEGQEYYENAPILYILADAGGANSCRGRLWKYNLQQFSNEIKIPIVKVTSYD